jgi:hypothetical protein
MPSNTRKQRLLREAHETERSDPTSVVNDCALIVAAVLALTIYWGAAAFAASSAINERGGANAKTLTLKSANPMGGSPNHATEAANGTNTSTP